MQDFVAIDFETANNHRSSACSVGAVRVRKGEIEDSFYSLIHPYPNYYWFTRIHGLSQVDTDDAPRFSEVWPSLKAFIGDLPLVAHNSPFDSSVLQHTLEHYGLCYTTPFFCTLKAARRCEDLNGLENYQLHTVAAQFGYDLANHHNALADAEACAVIAMHIL